MRNILSILLFASLACAQTAKYPSAIATDADLRVAKNGVRTTLTSSISPTSTSFTVSSAANMAPNMNLTLSGSEIVAVCSVTGTTIQVGVSSCPNVDGRGYNGTMAAYHVSGAPAASYPTAWDHNALKEEIKAIETALGTNLANVPGSETSLASRFSFTPQSPGGSLIAGANSITMAPVPPGVNGTDTDHYLYVSGGTGAAEACLIIGGSGVAGDASGQIIIQCAGAHSGAWTIGPAAGGIQEAICALPAAGGRVMVTSDITLRANVAWCGKAQVLVEKAAGATISGAFTVLGGVLYAGLDITYGNPWWSVTIDQSKTQHGLAIFPTFQGAGNTSIAYALQIQQSDPTKITSDTFFNGVGVDLHTNTPGPTNQNAAFMGFVSSYGGADPFGGDFHGIVPATATASPTFAVGVQATTQVDRAGATVVYPLIVSHESTAGKKANSMIHLYSTAGTSFLLSTGSGVLTDEGFILTPTDDLNAGYRMFGVTNAAGTLMNLSLKKNGQGYFRDRLVVGDTETPATDAALTFRAPTGTGQLIHWTQNGVAAANAGVKANDPNFYITNNYAGGALGDADKGIALLNTGHLKLPVMTVAALGTPANGSIAFASDGQVTGAGDNTVTGGGSGALVVRINGAWRCFALQN